MSGVSDPIGDYLTRLRNGIMAKNREVTVPASNLKVALSRILKEEGYIEDYTVEDDGKSGSIRIHLKYTNMGKSVITSLKRISKPGRRLYISAKELQKNKKRFGITILSTSIGVITDWEAIEKNIGGEIICEVW